MEYKEYLGEIPFNTLVTWYSTITKEVPFTLTGWTGNPKEPYRHWAAYPELSEYKVLRDIWEYLEEIFKDDGLHLVPERVIVNQFNFGDSSWLHKDCDKDNTWTVIVYLNPYWDINWAGDTVIVKNNEIVKAVCPTPGKIFLFKSNLLHGARPVSREASTPRVGLVYQCGVNVPKSDEFKVSSISTKV